MRAFNVAAAIAGLLLTLGVTAGAESAATPGKAKTAKSELAKKEMAKKKAKARERKSAGGMAGMGGGGGRGGKGGSMGGMGGMGAAPGEFGSSPPGGPSETSAPTDRQGTPDPVREPSPIGTRE
jgi:hypothetical protein